MNHTTLRDGVYGVLRVDRTYDVFVVVGRKSEQIGIAGRVEDMPRGTTLRTSTRAIPTDVVDR